MIKTPSLYIRRHLTKNSTVILSLSGSEKNYVILSLVRSLPKKEIERNPSRSWLMEKLGFITDEHQINVALTRAKRGLSIIGKKMPKFKLVYIPSLLLCFLVRKRFIVSFQVMQT